MVRATTAHKGSEVKYQMGNETNAAIKNNQSDLDIEISERFRKAKKAIKLAMAPEMPMGQAPTPPSASSCAKKTISVVMPQITQVKTWGLIRPDRIERI